MVEIRIHGRGGQGGVTLAKLIATSRFLRGRSVQAFGLYAAERSGAPIQAFCRFDDEPIRNRNLIYEPDHVVVLDPTLVGPGVAAGLKPGGWILLNTPEPPDALAATFPYNRLATVDATAIARGHGLGSRSVPIVNTALAGAVARMLEIPLAEMIAALEHMGFVGGNIESAKDAHAAVALRETVGVAAPSTNGRARPGMARRGPSFVRGDGGARPEVHTGQWATEQPRRQQYVPPCNDVCPAGNDVQGFLHALAEERVDDALRVLLHTTPFPSVCGRVCPAPCMDGCNRVQLDGAVNVRQLERFAGDHGSVTLEPAAPRPERVGIVGSGPAGLSAAYHLALLGYPVTVYESAAEIGGLLRSGIPEFRLPGAAVQREIDRILDLGVEVITELPIDRTRLLDVARSHDAVLVATGLQTLRGLGLEEPAEEGTVAQGIDFLEEVHRGGGRLDGEDVVVVGGGNTAMDAARAALRGGAASVRVLYRRSRAEMPAIPEEVREAIEEGVAIDFLTQPTAAYGSAQANGDSRCFTLRCRRMELGDPDASGRRRPVEVPDSDFDVPFTRLLLAIGQSADLSLFPDGTDVLEGERLAGPFASPVYALGDLATGEGTVAGAIGSGRRAAQRIHALFSGEALDQGIRVRPDVDVWHDEVIRHDRLKLNLFEGRRASAGSMLPIGRRRTTFDEVHRGLADAAEASRCLSCGVCNECDICVTYCPEGVLERRDGQMVFDYEYCKGCGICVAECPRNVLFMSHL